MSAISFQQRVPLAAVALAFAVVGCESTPTADPPDAVASVDTPVADVPAIDTGSTVDRPTVMDVPTVADVPSAMDRPAMDVALPNDRGGAADAPVGSVDGAVVGLPGVMCGTDRCAPGERCCNQFTSRACQPRTAVCPLVPTDCDGPEDCETGQICCVGPNAEMRIAAQCITGASCPGMGPTMSLQTCHADAECAARGVGTPLCCPFAGSPPLLHVRWCRAACD